MVRRLIAFSLSVGLILIGVGLRQAMATSDYEMQLESSQQAATEAEQAKIAKNYQAAAQARAAAAAAERRKVIAPLIPTVPVNTWENKINPWADKPNPWAKPPAPPVIGNGPATAVPNTNSTSPSLIQALNPTSSDSTTDNSSDKSSQAPTNIYLPGGQSSPSSDNRNIYQ